MPRPAQQPPALTQDDAQLALTELRRQFAMLTTASEVLASSLDWETTLNNVIDLTMPALADFGFFDVVEGDEHVRRIARAYHNAAKQAVLEATSWVRSDRADVNICALSSGAAGFHPHIDDAWLQDVAVTPEHLELMRGLAFYSMITVPLVSHERVLGALTLFYADSGRHYTQADLALAEELARRSAAAVENARLYRQAQQAIHARNEFLSVASHELRTPLTTLQAHAQLALRRLAHDRTLDPATMAASFQAITMQSQRLTRLISQLLDISRLEAGKLVLERSDTDLAALLRGAVEAAETRNTSNPIVLQAPATIPARLDPLRLEQVLANLLDNASRYSPPDSPIEVELSLAGDGQARISVRDRGRGIPPEKRRYIFERYYQAHDETHTSGMGLGLYISRQIVELHGGELGAEHPADGGTRFLIRLPLESESEPVALVGS